MGALGKYFRDLRLRQLFGRYATYCGSSPFEAPATLMLVAHVESQGVWHVEGGLSRLAAIIAKLAQENGARIRYRAEVAAIAVENGRGIVGVDLADGERIAADLVVANADAAALGAGLFGVRAARAVEAVPPNARSLSAVTLCARAQTSASRWCGTTCSSRAITRTNSRSSAPAGCPTIPRSMSARRTAPTTIRPSTDPSACSASSTPRPSAGNAPSPPRRSPHARPTYVAS